MKMMADKPLATALSEAYCGNDYFVSGSYNSKRVVDTAV